MLNEVMAMTLLKSHHESGMSGLTRSQLQQGAVHHPVLYRVRISSQSSAQAFHCATGSVFLAWAAFL